MAPCEMKAGTENGGLRFCEARFLGNLPYNAFLFGEILLRFFWGGFVQFYMKFSHCR